MNRISTCLALLLALGLSVVGTACSGDDDEPQNDPTAQSSDLTDDEKQAAQTKQTSGAVDPSAHVTENASLVKSCDNCGPLPDPWAKGPLPDPWKSTSSSGGSSAAAGASTDGTPHK